MTRRGFTLLEVVLVVGIIGMLTGIVGPRVTGRIDRARRTRAEADLATFAQALAQYRLDAGTFPTTEQGLDALVERPSTAPVPRAWNPRGYLDRLPADPWDHAYVYLSDGQRFRLWSFGADGVEGGRDARADVTHEG